MAPDYKFAWDPAKAAANLKKHGVSFSEAALVFADSLSSMQPDPHYENRWKTFGLVGSKLIVVVHEDAEHNVHGKAGITIRIISARNATPAEIRPYRNDPL